MFESVQPEDPMVREDPVVRARRRLQCAQRLERLRARWTELDNAPCGAPAGDGPDAPSALECLSDLRAAGRGLARIDWTHLAGDTQLAVVTELEQARRALDAALAAGLAAVDRCSAAEAASALPTRAWFAHATGGSGAEAARMVCLGRTLERFELFAAAILSGELSSDHGRVLGSLANPRVIHQLLAIEATLVEAARTVSFRDWQRDMRALVALLDADGPEPDTDTNTVSLSSTGGTELLKGQFTGEPGTLLRHALTVETARQRRAAWEQHRATGTPVPGASQLRARALTELIRRALGSDPATSRGPHTDAVVVIEANDTAAERVRTLDGDPIDAGTAALLTCDAALQALIVDTTGNPLWMGDRTRYATQAQRRALALRDGGCVFPGCDAPPSWCDAHHQPGWQHGGTTDIDRLALLCRRHHGTAHSTHWTLKPTGPPGGHQRYEWINHHTGQTIAANQRGLH